MGAILFLMVGITFGYTLCNLLFPTLRTCCNRTFDGKEIKLSSFFVRIPAIVVAGIIPLTWVTYLFAYVIKVCFGVAYPLFLANLFAMSLFVMASLVMFLIYRKKKCDRPVRNGIVNSEWVFLAFLLLLSIALMFGTFSVSGGKLYIGLTVFSDFAPHMGMIRSFSYGNNFPTSYSHFAGEDIRYHFMFQFLVGNLEFLGMRIDFAFNLPSIFGVFGTCTVLYALAVRLTGKRLTGYLTTIFFLYRSSMSFFKFLADQPKGQVLKNVIAQNEFFKYSPNEDWGLWCQNVYCNQRHFAFAIIVLLLALHFFLPYLYEMGGKLVEVRRKLRVRREEAIAEGKQRFLFSEYIETYGRALFFNKEAFFVAHPVRAVFLGILLGMLAFFNGSVLTAACVLLFFMAAFSNRRLDYLISAGIALAMSLLEASFFIKGSAVSPKYFFGFIAENKTFYGAMEYAGQLLGLLAVCMVIYLFLGKGVKRYLIFVFTTPAIMAFTVSLTTDVTVNHKFVMISMMLLSVYSAIIVGELLSRDGVVPFGTLTGRRVLASIMIVMLTITGVFESKIVFQRNNKNSGFVFEMKDPLVDWVKENADSDDIFLTSTYHIHRVVLGGGMLFYGWPYYAWSAGYDTYAREDEVAWMYSASTVDLLQLRVKRNNIRYIVVDGETRTSNQYKVREDVISMTYEAVYTEGEGDWKFTIYDTQKPKK